MSDCANLRFGYNNRLINCTLASDPSPSTSLSYVKNEYKSRPTVFDQTNSAGNIVITGTFYSPQYLEFIALPSAPLIGDAEIKVELFLTPATTTDLLSMPFTPMRRATPISQIPLGTFQVGIDPFNGSSTIVEEVPETFVHWFEDRVYCSSFSLTIRRSSSSDQALSNVQIRTIFMGDMIEMANNFSFGHAVSFMSRPSLTQTSTGSWISTNRRLKSRKMQLSLDQMDGEDYKKLHYLETQLLSDPFIISAYPSETETYLHENFNMMARFKDEIEFLRKYEDVYRTSLTIVEV